MLDRIRENWFWPLALALWSVAFLVSRNLPTSELTGWELAVIADVIITMPVLFVLCYRAKFTWKTLAVRILALQCLGIWIASEIVPIESQQVLPQLSWLRYAGIALLVMIELKIMYAMFKIMFKTDTTTTQLENTGMPPMLAKLALLEVRFWRWVFSIFKR